MKVLKYGNEYREMVNYVKLTFYVNSDFSGQRISKIRNFIGFLCR